MSVECFPITVLPHVSALYRDYLAMGESPADAAVRRWYGAEPLAQMQMWQGDVPRVQAERLSDALERQSLEFGACAAALANIAKLRSGARAVVTGQQVGLFGGPLLTLLKAATAVTRAKQATVATGIEHVPVFWLATEDHDLPEVNQVSLLTSSRAEGAAVETLRANLKVHHAVPVGTVVLGEEIEPVLQRACELLGWAPICDLLRKCYAPGQSLGGAFARLMAKLFEAQGLVVMDAAGREFHALGGSTLRYAIEHAEELESALLARSEELTSSGYHAQVLVKEGASLLFVVDEASGERQVLKRTREGIWRAGGRNYSTAELLDLLEAAPERLSPNALLRPVFQDTILPTAAYVGGPAEIAYFAQSAVLYEAILGRVTPVLPRLTATLVEPSIASVMQRHEVSLPDAMSTAEDLAQRLGARAMPIAAKRKLAAAGNALETALAAAEEYLGGMDESLGKSVEVSGSKMRYQMNRMRRIAATFELQKEASLRHHAEAITTNLFPDGHPQERVVAGIWFAGRYEGLVERLVQVAENLCPGHVVVRL